MICITLGGGAELAIDTDRIVIIQRNEREMITAVIDLGRATQHRLETLQDHIGRLMVHNVPEQVLVA